MYNITLCVISNITGAIYFFSPLILFYNYYKNKFKNWYCLPGMQLFANLFNSLFWIVWCLAHSDPEMFKNSIVNYLGASISLLLIFYYWHAAFKIRFREHFIHLFSIWNVIFQIGWASALLTNRVIEIATVFNFLMYISVYKNIIYSYRNNVKEVLPIIESCIAIVNTTLWVLFGIIDREKCSLHYVIPNAISLFFLIIGFIVTIYLKIRVVETHSDNPISMKLLNDRINQNYK